MLIPISIALSKTAAINEVKDFTFSSYWQDRGGFQDLRVLYYKYHIFIILVNNWKIDKYKNINTMIVMNNFESHINEWCEFKRGETAVTPPILFDIVFNNAALDPIEIDDTEPTPWMNLQLLDEEWRRRRGFGRSLS